MVPHPPRASSLGVVAGGQVGGVAEGVAVMLTRSQRLARNALLFIIQVFLAAVVLWAILLFWLSLPVAP
jgi:hypothetical protein